ncbi:hypothetical protein U1Q18_033449 [Sarracenia purpurea var. burkii]
MDAELLRSDVERGVSKLGLSRDPRRYERSKRLLSCLLRLSGLVSSTDVMRWGMEILSPASSYLSHSNWLVEESRTGKWTPVENKIFENALAVYDKDTPDRWQKVAAMVPGKTVREVMQQYKELEDDVSCIEAGLVPIPGYGASPFTLEWGNTHGLEGITPACGPGGRRSSSALARPSEQERKKGVPWTEEEHKLFLMGLKKYGKGDWRNISRNYVITRTPTQVASHAQKYFIRQLSGGKDKRRASIHDITTVNLNDTQTPPLENKTPPSPEQSPALTRPPNSALIPRTHFHWNQPVLMGFDPTRRNMFVSACGMIDSYGLKMEAQNLERSSGNNGCQDMGFQMAAAAVDRYPYG